MDRPMCMSDEQYLKCLDKLMGFLANNKDVKPEVVDDTTLGNKSTSSNCGMCNKELLCTEETALFLDDFTIHGRKDMKYRQGNQPCPMDSRTRMTEIKDLDFGRGCFYTCIMTKRVVTREDAIAYVKDTKEKFLVGRYENGRLRKLKEI